MANFFQSRGLIRINYGIKDIEVFMNREMLKIELKVILQKINYIIIR